MLKYFQCPDGSKVEVAQCLKYCPKRCLSLPTLYSISETREWKGKASTTQCLNGTRYSYLHIVKDYTVNPFEQAFSLLGTNHHRKLDAIAQKLNVLSEEKLDEETTGIFDLLEPDVDKYILTDYKTWGSYKVAKTLGIVSKKVADPSGAVYIRDSPYGKRGQPKMIDEFFCDMNKTDTFESDMQLNNYRIMIEQLGFPVSAMRIQATVRDGGTISATGRGVMQNIVMIPVQRLDDEEVTAYFSEKNRALVNAVETRHIPPPCNSREKWEGRRCKEYCNVSEFCPEVSKEAMEYYKLTNGYDLLKKV